MFRFAAIFAFLCLSALACRTPESPVVSETALSDDAGPFIPSADPSARDRAPGEFEIISVYEYPDALSGSRDAHIVAVDLDVSARATVDLGALELTDAERQTTYSAFRVYRLDDDGDRVGMHDPAFASGSRFFVAFAVPEIPAEVTLQYWRMPLSENAIEVAATGGVHPEARVEVLAASHEEPWDWFQTHWLLVEIENAGRTERIDAPFDCDGRVSRSIELDGDARWTELAPRPPIVPIRRVLIEQRCWIGEGAEPPVVAPGVPDVDAAILAIADELPEGATVLTGHWGVVRSLSFSRDGARLAVAANGRVAVWDVDAAARVMAIEQDQVVRQVLLSPDGTRLVVSAVDHAPTLWDVESGTRLRELLMSGTPSTSSQVRMSPSGQLFGVDSAMGVERALTVWGARSGAPALRIGPAPFTSWGFADDGFAVLTCSSDDDGRQWDLADGSDATGTHRCPLVTPPSRVVPAGAAPEFLLAEPMAAELAALPENGSRIAFPIGPSASGADRVVVVLIE